MPAVGTAVAVTGQGLTLTAADASSVSAAPVAAVSGATAGTAISIAPQLQPNTAEMTTLVESLQARKKMKTPRLSLGLRSNGYVLYVQKKLGVLPRTAKLNTTKGAGYFGPQTRAAVMRFQRENGIDAVGSVGPNTWKALTKVGAGKVYKFKATKTAKAKKVTRASRSETRAPLRKVASGSRANRVLAYAKTKFDEQYVYGGTGGRGYDCSGFVGWVYEQVGVNLPRTSGQIYNAVDHISKSSARPGDLFFVRSKGGSIYHVGIVGSGGKWFEARNSRYDIGAFTPWASGSSVVYGRA